MPVQFIPLVISLWTIFYVASIDDNVPIFLNLAGKWVQSRASMAITWVKVYHKFPWEWHRVSKNADRNARELAKALGLDENEDWN